MGLLGKKQKPVEIPFATKNQIDGITKLARNKTLGEMRNSIIAAQKEKRLIFLDNGNADYTDKKGKYGVYNDEQFAAVLWKIFDDKFSEGKFGGMTAGLTMLAITEIDIKKIIEGIRGR